MIYVNEFNVETRKRSLTVEKALARAGSRRQIRRDSGQRSMGETTMNGAIRALRLFAAAAMIVTGVGAVTPSQAQTGSVHLHIVKAGFIVGLGGGSGTLYYEGHTYRLSVGGIGAGSLGIAGVNLRGTASNLRHPADIAGTYGAAGAGVTFVGGGQVVTLQNEKGVVLTLSGPQVGFQVSLGLGGMTIALK